MKRSMVISAIAAVGFASLQGSPYKDQMVGIYNASSVYALTIRGFNEQTGFASRRINNVSGTSSRLWVEDNSSCTRYVIDSRFGRICLRTGKKGWFYYRLHSATTPIDDLKIEDIQLRNNLGAVYAVKMGENVAADSKGMVYFIVDVGLTTKNNIKIKMKKNLPNQVQNLS